MAVVNYDPYLRVCAQAAESDVVFADFKRHPDYTAVLEHVTGHGGLQYLEAIAQLPLKIPSELVSAYCAANDERGGGAKAVLGGLVTSPSNLRYLLHASLALQHCKDTMTACDGVTIVEVGGGYGGLCLAVAMLANLYSVVVRRYIIVDRAEALQLQAKYLRDRAGLYPVEFVDAATSGVGIEGSDLFLISNYCFSEISAPAQRQYKECLISRVQHGFFVWNICPVFDFGKPVLAWRPEVPNTAGPGLYPNCYVYF